MKIQYSLLLLLLIAQAVFSQDTDKEAYELLQIEFDVLQEYTLITPFAAQMADSAKKYASDGDYSLARIFLEEAKMQPTNEKPAALKNVKEENKSLFTIDFISGVDYNKQEFELGFEQSDSVLLDELSKPYLGFNVLFGINPQTTLENRLRYDKENLQNEFLFHRKTHFKKADFTLKLGAIYDKNYAFKDLGYAEGYANLSLKSKADGSNYWGLINLFRYKSFESPVQTMPSFYRNTFSTFWIKNISMQQNLHLDYGLDFNNSINYQNNDFLTHDAGVSYQNTVWEQLHFNITTRYRTSDFTYVLQNELQDSSFSNQAKNISIAPQFDYYLTNAFGLELDYNWQTKTYKTKTEQEPDFIHHKLMPALFLNASADIRLKAGYLYENKTHETVKGLNQQYIIDQNYNSTGLFAELDYTSLTGVIFSFNVEYLFRRYPDIQQDAAFNLYSNRNVLSLLLYAHLPVSQTFSVNVLGVYDNDEDIENDFNDTASSFYTVEFVLSL